MLLISNTKNQPNHQPNHQTKLFLYKPISTLPRKDAQNRKAGRTCLFCSTRSSQQGQGPSVSQEKETSALPGLLSQHFSLHKKNSLLLTVKKKKLHYLFCVFLVQLRTKLTTFNQSGYSHNQEIIQILFFSIQGTEGKTLFSPSILPAATFKPNSSNRT